mmetsp:Transcript_28873/g.72491  ORF Transcript_28873/g.72491 Transcript_28873/m.72491 type:complete len:392 (-) Transcript_28873:1284-2459(-)
MASQSFWWFSSAFQARSSWGGLRRQTVPLESKPCFLMISTICSSFFFFFSPLGAHLGFKCTSSWSLKPPQINARMVPTSSEKIFLYSESVGKADLTSSSRLSTLNRMACSSRDTAAAPGLRGFKSLARRWQRSTASLARASNFFGMMFHSLAKEPMALGPLGAPALIHSANKSRNIKGSECLPRSHHNLAAKERSNFLQYSFWSLTTSRLGVLNGSAAVSPATIATASQGQPNMRPQYSKRHSRSSQGKAIARYPKGVISASSAGRSMHPTHASSVMAASTRVVAGGCTTSPSSNVGVDKSISISSGIKPRFHMLSSFAHNCFACRYSFVSGAFSISGGSNSTICDSKKSRVTRRTARPGIVRPARPARCLQEDCEHQVVTRQDMSLRASY